MTYVFYNSSISFFFVDTDLSKLCVGDDLLLCEFCARNSWQFKCKKESIALWQMRKLLCACTLCTRRIGKRLKLLCIWERKRKRINRAVPSPKRDLLQQQIAFGLHSRWKVWWLSFKIETLVMGQVRTNPSSSRWITSGLWRIMIVRSISCRNVLWQRNWHYWLF